MANVYHGIIATEASIHSRSALVFSFGGSALALLTPLLRILLLLRTSTSCCTETNAP